MKRAAALGFFLVLASVAAAQEGHISARQAKDHVGEVQTVCGKVVSTRYASGTKGQPTFMNLDESYPNQIFTIVIWGENRAKFGNPETEYREATVCATGKIVDYRGTPEITVSDPKQIVLSK